MLEYGIAVGLVFLGTVSMGAGYLLSLTTPLTFGKTDTMQLATQLNEVGFILVAVGFLAWFMIYALKKAEVL
jgi:hypothetical protein